MAPCRNALFRKRFRQTVSSVRQINMSEPSVVNRVLKFIRFSHTIFALPFALGSMLVAAHGLPGWRVVTLILLAMVFARTSAMAFNRVADWELDQANPR